MSYSKQKRSYKGLAILLLVMMILVPLILYAVSIYSVKASFRGVTFKSADPLSAIISRKVGMVIYLDVVTGGPFAIPVKGLSVKLYMEGIYVGTVRSVEGFTIPIGEPRTISLDATIDLSSLSLEDIGRLIYAVSKGEISIDIEGWVDLILLAFTLTVPISYRGYFAVGSPKPVVEAVYWGASEATPGETVSFTVKVRNQYRGITLDGVLEVTVVEDVMLGFDKDVGVYRYPVRLNPGEAIDCTGWLTVYAKEFTNGFYLKVCWDSSKIYEMPNSYPPRLRIAARGRLELVDAYWVVRGVVSFNCTTSDLVEARIVVVAVGGWVSGDLEVRVKKDLVLVPDKDYIVRVFKLDLKKNERREITVSFIPDEASGLYLRGYFIELRGLISWTMKDSYPPRLKVVPSKR